MQDTAHASGAVGREWMAGTFGLALSAALATSVSLALGLRPNSSTSADSFWFAAYAGLVVCAGGLCWFRRGSLLLWASLAALMVSLLTTALGSEAVYSYLALLWILVVAASVGDWLLRWCLAGAPVEAAVRGALGITLGLGVLALLTMALGLLRLLYPATAISLLLSLSLLCGRQYARWLWPELRSALSLGNHGGFSSDRRFLALIVALLLICFIGGLLWAVAPSTHFDALTYHLGVPAVYVREHAIVPVPEEYRSVWAHNMEMLYTLSLLVAGQPLPGLLHLSMSVISLVFVAFIGQRMGGRRAGYLAAVLFYSAPLVTFEAGAAYNGIAVTAFVLGSVYCFLRWWQTDEAQWLPLAGLLAGLAVGTKLNACLVLLPLGLLVFGAVVARHGASRHAAALFLGVGAPALIAALPWLVRDWLWTGNPVFPYLNSLFHSKLWVDASTWENWSHFGKGHDLLSLLRLPWDMVVTGRAFAEAGAMGAGGLSLLALPWLYLGDVAQRNTRLGLALVAGCSLALWFAIGPYLRLFIVGFPLLAILGGLNLASLWDRLVAFRARRCLAALSLVVGLGYVLGTRWVLTGQWVRSQPDRYPLRLALGLETPEQYLSRTLPVYDAFQFLAQVGDGRHRVLGFDMDFRLYTESRVESVKVEKLLSTGNGETSSEETARELARRGYEYIVVAFRRGKPLNQAFLARYGRLVYGRHQVFVYRFLEHGTSVEDGVELLADGGFEVDAVAADAKTWSLQGDVALVRSDSDVHSGLLCFSRTWRFPLNELA